MVNYKKQVVYSISIADVDLHTDIVNKIANNSLGGSDPVLVQLTLGKLVRRRWSKKIESPFTTTSNIHEGSRAFS